ncbi:MAG: glutamate N-acetyltransferase/amino-acid N-acetyltransferase [Rickettsiales bacterium]|jgi:glutamate N-acetyltransferase/amino-acid N-acetyltransferase
MLEIEGLKIATINSGIKYKDRHDLLLIEMPKGSIASGVFTKSDIVGDCITEARKNIKNGGVRSLIVNSGNANVFNGKFGQEAVNNINKTAANLFNCKQEEVYSFSTGVIGEILNDKLITEKLPKMFQKLDQNEDSWKKAASAILTTDLKTKKISKKFEINGQEVRINAIAKGSGMIAPNMATMLSFIFTDIDIDQKILQKIFSEINEISFNSITVDSDTSTSDAAMIFSTKKAENYEITDINDPSLVIFKENLSEIMIYLAKEIVADGEGAKKLIEINVRNAKSQISAKNIAFSVANSPLVKTAIAGSDPNWGRILMAVGKVGEKIDPTKINIKIGDNNIVTNGAKDPLYSEEKTHNYLKSDKIYIEIDLNIGSFSRIVWSCDFNEGYIKINKDYRS